MDAIVDAGPPDTGDRDSTSADTASVDVTADRGPIDAGTPDLGVDVTPADSGRSDTGAPDLVMTDTGPSCAATETLCAGACVNLLTSATHCGACGRVCSSGQFCLNAECHLPCPAGQTECGAVCADTASDAAHCGGCGVRCAAGLSCVSSVCTLVCPTGQSICAGACIDTQTDRRNCGACGMACDTGQVCTTGVCRAARACDDLLRQVPGTPSGSYIIDPDGPGGRDAFRVFCDMTTDGGGWTLVAASVGDTNMPRFTNNAVVPCVASTPNAPCFMGRAALGALTSREFAWSTGPTAVNSRAPIDAHLEGAADTNAICINNTEYFRLNQDVAGQGMGWTGCEPTEVYSSISSCNGMFRPVWNLLVCDGLPISPGARTSPDYNCSPFGHYGSTCTGFYNLRHWRR